MFKFFRRLLLLLVIAGLGVGGYFAVVNRWINVNSWLVMGQTRGVDVSSYQEKVDFNKLKEQGMEFAYIKATEGASHVDTSFSEKWAAAAAAGVPAGAYHYFNYDMSGTLQAENFIQTVGELEAGRLIPAVDMELTTEEVKNPPAVDAVVKGLKAFLAVVEEKYGVKPLIYAQQDYYDKYLKADFSSYPRWVSNVLYPVYFQAGEEWLVWQYNDHGELAGYSGEKYIDLNMVNRKFGVETLKMP